MSDLRKAIMLVLAISLTGCATPPGKLTDADFVSKELPLDISVSLAATQLREGLRYCGPHSGGVIFVTHHGVPDCMPTREDGSVMCDLYIGGADGGRSGAVLGGIELIPVNSGTLAILRVRTYAANKDKIIEAWKLFLCGRAKDVCP